MQDVIFRFPIILILIPLLILLVASCFAAEPANEQQSNMILVTGIDGTVGYIYESDLQSKNLSGDDSILDDLQNLKENAALNGQNAEYVMRIPLYAEDGKTVIGQYGLGYMGGDYGADMYHIVAGPLKSNYPTQAYHDAEGNVHLVEINPAEIEPYLIAEGAAFYAYMTIAEAEPNLIPVILEARRQIIYQGSSGWVDDSVDGCIKNESGEVIEILPHFHEVFPSDWEIPWFPPEYNTGIS